MITLMRVFGSGIALQVVAALNEHGIKAEFYRDGPAYCTVLVKEADLENAAELIYKLI